MAGKIRKSNLHNDVKTMVTDMISEQALDSANFDSVLSSKTTDDITEGSTNQYYTSTRADSDFDARLATKTTGDISEGSNLYYTSTRADSDFDVRLATKTTGDISEGSNLYYTDARADARITLQTGSNLDLSSKSTSDLSEGSNLYYTDARADARIAAATTADLTEGSNLYYTTARGDSDTGVYISGDRSYGNITTTGYIRGPSTFYIDPAPVDSDAGLLIIRGDLQVDGTTTTVNSTTVTINDKNIVLADSAANAAEADGAGITVNGASATITYDAANDEWDFNKPINIPGGTTTGNVSFGDDDKAIFGAGSDLQIHHNSTNSFITNATGTLYIQQAANDADVRIRSDNGSGGYAEYITAEGATGEVQLHHYGSEKLATKSTGVDITGTLTSDGLTVDGSSIVATFGNSATNNYAQIKRITSNVSTLTLGVSSNLAQITGGPALSLSTGAADGTSEVRRMLVSSGGDISFYETTGATAKFFWDASAESLGIGTSSPLSYPKITVYDASTKNSGFVLQNTTTGQTSNDGLFVGLGIGGSGDAQTAYLYHREAGPLVFATSNTEQMRIDSSGNVGIGTSSPQRPLHVDGAEGVARFTSTASGNNGFEVGIGTSSQAFLWQSENSYMHFATNATERMRIDSSGSLLVNRTSKISSEKLSVKGEIRAGYTSSDNQVYLGVDTANAYLGTNASGFGLKFEAGGSERMRIDSSGNVGIGTTSPDVKLSVSPDDDISAKIGRAFIGKGTDAGLTDWAVFGHIDNQAANQIALHQSSTGQTVLNAASGQPILFRIANATKATITSGGNVGIGTTNPSEKLHIEATNPQIRLLNNSTGQSGLEWWNDYGGVDHVNTSINWNEGSANWEFKSYRSDSQEGNPYGNIDFYNGSPTSPTLKLRITTGGNVGIGTSSPSQKLTVYNGNILVDGPSGSDPKIEFHQPTNTGEGGVIVYNDTDEVFTVASRMATYGDINFAIGMNDDDPTDLSYSKMFIRASGNVGIGTTTPSNQLEITGGANKAVISVTNADLGSLHYTDRNGRYLTSNGAGWTSGIDGADPGIVIGGDNSSGQIKGVGIVLHNDNNSDNQYSPTISFGNKSNSGAYNTAYAHIIGRKTGQAADANWSAGELGFYTQPVGGYVTNETRMIIKSDGKVGIGTNSPSANLTVEGTGGTALHINNTDGSNTVLYLKGANGADWWGMFTGSTGGGFTLKDETNTKDAFNARPQGYMAYPNQPRFSAFSQQGSTSYSSGTAFVLEVVRNNIGSGYNPANGIFVAPEDGYYQFRFNAYTYVSGQWCVYKWQGSTLAQWYDDNGAGTVGGDHTALCTVTANAIHHMTWTMYLTSGTGCAVGWRSGYSGNIYRGHSQFSGELISAD